MSSDDRGRRRGDDRRRSRSRSRRRRSRSRERRRTSSRSRSRGRHERARSRSKNRRERRSRSQERQRYRSRSHERRHGGGGGPPRRPEQSPPRWQHDRYRSTFTRGGRINENVPAGLVVQPSARLGHYTQALLAGFDDDWEGDAYGYDDEQGEGEAPSATLRVTGLPEDARQGDLAAMFEPVSGIREIRLPRDPDNQHCKGFAFLEFESVDAAVALMGSDWREQTFYGQHRLRFEYARPRQDPAHADWVCELCQAVNFGRRSECYQCQRGRTPGARPVLSPADEPPSCILRVAGVQPSTDEEALRFAFVPHAPVRDIRMLRERLTGEPRGVAYIQFYSIEDAGKALAACQERRLDSQPDHPLRISYARDRFAGDPHYQQYLAQQQQAPEAAAEAALAWAGWQPKEFGGEAGGGAVAVEDDDPLAAWERQQAAEAAGDAAPAQAGASAPEEGEVPRQPGDAAAMVAAEAAAAAQAAAAQAAAAQAAAEEHYDPLAAGAELQGQGAGESGAGGLDQQRAAAEAAGFVYDAESGYMRDPASGYYYDANTGLYCHPTLQQWGSYDFASGQFIPHDAAAGEAVTAAAAAPGFSSAADSALALGGAALYAAKQAGPAARQQQAANWHAAQQWHQQGGGGGSQPTAGSYEEPAGPAQRPRRGAIIGAAAQLDPQGLMIAAQAAEEKAQLLRKQQEMQEAKRKRVEARRQQQQQPRQTQPGGSAAATAAPPPGAAAAAAPAAAAAAQPGGGPVHGVIHESSWAAARRAQQQAQHGRQ